MNKTLHSWATYIFCVLGYGATFCVLFLLNGGGDLLDEELLASLRSGWLGSFVDYEFPWSPFSRVTVGDTEYVFIVAAFLSIFLANACTIISWNVGFLWPLGIVLCRRKRPNTINDIAVPTGCNESAVGFEKTKSMEERFSCGKLNPAPGYVGEFVPEKKISLRVVTRGDSAEFVARICKSNLYTLERFLANEEMTDESASLWHNAMRFEWILEVVTERPLGLDIAFQGGGTRVFEIVVPTTYETPNKTLAKARNLHFANEPNVSILTEDDFVVHLDEETRITKSSLEGIMYFLARNPNCIGQGLTSFGRGETLGNCLLTMCDSSRIADDFLSFRVWHTVGSGLRGMKGSNFVVRVGIEKQVSFDVGKNCSSLEDTAFALSAVQHGVRFGFVRGIMDEQSPLTFGDFFRQRRRWIRGLISVCCAKWIKLQYRLFIMVTLMSWIMAPASLLLFFSIVMSVHIPSTFVTVTIRTLIYSTAFYGAICGAVINFSPSGGLCRYIFLILTNTLLIPLFSLLEAMAIIYGLTTSPKAFEVVRKKSNPTSWLHGVMSSKITKCGEDLHGEESPLLKHSVH